MSNETLKEKLAARVDNMSGDMLDIFNRLEDIDSRKRKHVLVAMFTAMTFAQPYNVYPVLKTAYEFLLDLDRKLGKETE